MGPESAADLLRYLDGRTVPNIGKDGKQTLAAVTTLLQERLETAITKYNETTDEAMLTSTSLSKKRKHSDTNPLCLVAFGPDGVFYQNPAIPDTWPTFPSAEGGLEGGPDHRCRFWFSEFFWDQSRTMQLEGGLPSKRVQVGISRSESETSSTASPSTGCLLFSRHFELDEHLDILLASEGDERTSASRDFCERLVKVMIRWLENVSGVSVKNLDRPDEEILSDRTKRRTFDGWQDAWATEYRGNALLHLENKLRQLSLDVKDHSVSRLIPVVQASGAGKSRLAEMYLHSSTALTFVGTPQGILLSTWASAMAIVSPHR